MAGLGFRVAGLGRKVWGLRFRVQVEGLGFRMPRRFEKEMQGFFEDLWGSGWPRDTGPGFLGNLKCRGQRVGIFQNHFEVTLNPKPSKAV